MCMCRVACVGPTMNRLWTSATAAFHCLRAAQQKIYEASPQSDSKASITYNCALVSSWVLPYLACLRPALRIRSNAHDNKKKAKLNVMRFLWHFIVRFERVIPSYGRNCGYVDSAHTRTAQRVPTESVQSTTDANGKTINAQIIMTERARKRATHGYSLLCHLMTKCYKVKDESVGRWRPMSHPSRHWHFSRFLPFFLLVRCCDEFNLHVDSSRSNWIWLWLCAVCSHTQ